eukprot:6214375-Pleurochrysis_carterae.AAC.1
MCPRSSRSCNVAGLSALCSTVPLTFTKRVGDAVCLTRSEWATIDGVHHCTHTEGMHLKWPLRRQKYPRTSSVTFIVVSTAQDEIKM